jgi:hypothetical protein
MLVSLEPSQRCRNNNLIEVKLSIFRKDFDSASASCFNAGYFGRKFYIRSIQSGLGDQFKDILISPSTEKILCCRLATETGPYI